MTRPSPKIVVVIAVDPTTSHRAVEALRIALGLGSHNDGSDLRLILSGRAPFLLGEDMSVIVDGDILEQHLPVFLEWGATFSIADDAEKPPYYLQSCITTTLSLPDMTATIAAADRVLIFS